MSDAFDPYRQWLNIADPQRPPNHYVLLGQDLFESDNERIWNASMNLMARVLEHDPGPHCEDARRVFDELEIARDCLCDPERKQAYDTQLRKKLDSAAATIPPARKKSWGRLTTTEDSSLLHRDASRSGGSSVISCEAGATSAGSTISRRVQKAARAEHPSPRLQLDERQKRTSAVVLAVLALVGLAGYFVFREPPEHNPAAAIARQLHHHDSQQRLKAARALKKLGLRAHEAVPQLVAALETETNEDVRLAISEALRDSGPATLSYSQQLASVAERETHPGVVQILAELLTP